MIRREILSARGDEADMRKHKEERGGCGRYCVTGALQRGLGIVFVVGRTADLV